jgi:hypothetical protein
MNNENEKPRTKATQKKTQNLFAKLQMPVDDDDDDDDD